MEMTESSSLSPYLMVNDGEAALDFYERAFGATVTETYPYDGKLGHATLSINGADVMLSDEFPEEVAGTRTPHSLGGTTVTLSLNVDDADVWFERAIAAGGVVQRPLSNDFYGRAGKLLDPFGHLWGIVGPLPASDLN